MKIVLLLIAAAAFASAQRITTIQLDNVQYFVSRMNPYSPELNYFLAYQYCRSLGLQLVSFETKEKADTMSEYLKNAGYTNYDFWTSGNKIGTNMFLWMSTGIPFNASFSYINEQSGSIPIEVPPGTEPQRVARESGNAGSSDSCVAMTKPNLEWMAQDCSMVKDFICEQTRCYYYNYGSIPVSATQGNRKPYIASTAAPTVTHQEDDHTKQNHDDEQRASSSATPSPKRSHEDPINRITSALPAVARHHTTNEIRGNTNPMILEKSTRNDHIPDITSLFSNAPSQVQKDTAFDGLETHEVRSLSRSSPILNAEHREEPTEYETGAETELPNNALLDPHTVGPYNSMLDYQSDQAIQSDQSELVTPIKDHEEDSSTILPDAEPAYRYSIKVRNNGKVLDPPSK
ncbi:uncharacterized protein LOC122510232 isoform X2 [Leptopilina heterotoma]|uniref:uncharacterized protein LOC122510232 isoform X2 n=2 Tax=Leptopilina heterotoma TaxID=63436 RepID=UPI001CA90F4B|nr:uncharacterized protein LOC122510232 isoform X2 [Leptopilina heterotoma]